MIEKEVASVASDHIIATYSCSGVTVRIADDALAALSPEQLARNRRNVQRVASRILKRAMDRGEVEGLTPEEWRRRYGREPEGGID